MGFMSLLAQSIKTVADMMASVSFGTISIWSMYQPKEPKNIK